MPLNIKAISQTLINEMRRCEHRFKLVWVDRVLGGGGQSSLPMEVGNCFDAYCRCALNRQLDLDKELINRDGNEPPQRAVELGRHLFMAYKASGAFQALKDEGVAIVGASAERLIDGVPLAGMPDIVLHDGTIVDWKTSGVTSKRGADPKIGYNRAWKWTGQLWLKLPKHPQCGALLEDIYPRWARQNVCYAALLGKKIPFTGLKAGIDAIFVNGPSITIAQYRTRISDEFQIEVWKDIHWCWKRIQTGIYGLPTYSDRKCKMWGRDCEVSHLCPAWERAHTSSGGWLDAMH